MFTADEWKIKIDELKKSGLSQVQWAKAHGIKYHLVKYWFYRLRALEQNKSPSQPLFKELKQTSYSGITIKWGDLILEIAPDFDENTLKRFLKVLG